MRKLNVLFNTEASYLGTGFSVYYKEVMSRLHATGKYNLVELASFGEVYHPLNKTVPWIFVPTKPNPHNPEEIALFNRDRQNIYGKWLYEKTLVKYGIDIVCSARDAWMSRYECLSPYRKYYKLVQMPTVDGEPLEEEWLAMYANCDKVFTYSDYGFDTLYRESHGSVNLVDAAPPAADYNVFKPIQNVRQKYNLSPNIFIIGTTMRNQGRKHFPYLIDHFAELYKQLGEKEKRNTFLYLHTCWPDLTWDIPKLIKESGLGHKILCTYLCQNCKKFFPSVFSYAFRNCVYCNQISARMPTPDHFLTRENLSEVYNLFNVYVQYSCCFAGDTEIQTENGWKQIKNVGIGEKVFTHNGNWQKVVNKFVRKSDTINEISCFGTFEKILATDEHPFLCLTKQDFVLRKENRQRTVRELLGDCLRNKKPFPSPSFKKVSELSKNDILYYKINDAVVETELVDLSKFLSERDSFDDSLIHVKSGNSYNRFIKVDADFCRFIGMFVADGCSTAGIVINQSSKKIEGVNFAKKWFESRGFNSSIYTSKLRDKIVVRTHCGPFQKFLETYCLKNERKKLPDFCELLPTDLQKQILIGLFNCDGHYCKDRKCSNYATISPTLARQIVSMLDRLRIQHSVSKTERSKKIYADGKNRKDIYKFEIYANILDGELSPTKNSTKTMYFENFKLSCVKSISRQSHEDLVYNIEVEHDNTYQVRISSVHNCEGAGMPQMEAAACGIPITSVDYSAMSDIVRKLEGFPIKVKMFSRDQFTHRKFAHPDCDSFISICTKLIRSPKEVLSNLGYKAAVAARKHYQWDETARKWENVIDNLDCPPHDQTWLSPPKYHNHATQIPAGLDNQSLVNWCLVNIAGRPDLVGTYWGVSYARDLMWRCKFQNLGGVHFSENSIGSFGEPPTKYEVDDFLNECKAMCDERNAWEQYRIENSR